jgi:NhaP-type Na+/H+ or K+/H+ antiporter
LNLLRPDVTAEGLRSIAELTLAFVLFTDAAKSNLGASRETFRIPQRLLLIGLPLTILLGFGLGAVLFKGLSLLEVAILATMLAPTDAALGKAVVSDESVPGEIREGLNVESGLNDGICVPVLFVFLALAVEGAAAEGGASLLVLKLVVEEIGIGAAVGGVLGITGSLLIRMFARRGWFTESWRQLPVVAMAVCCFATAQSLGGSGFIAAFIGGLMFGRSKTQDKHGLLLAAEGTGDTFALLTWVIFGAAVVGRSYHSLTWQVVLYAVLSLTLIRMLPVFLSLAGMNVRTEEKLFMGWFGPRGLASIVFALIVFHEQLPGGHTITMTVVATVVLSVVAHGLSANPLIKRLAAKEA